jgi:hypothetical protein
VAIGNYNKENLITFVVALGSRFYGFFAIEASYEYKPKKTAK